MFDTFFYNPVYNLVIFLSDYISDLGIVIIITTLIIKFLLYPLFKKQIHSQIAMKKAKPELEAITKKSKDKTLSPEERQQLGMETMMIYKKHGVNPFSMIFSLLIQIPIIFALYWVVYKSGLPKVDESVLYPFVSIPEHIKMMFLDTIDLTQKSYLLAVLAGLSQFLVFHISMPDATLRNLKTKSDKWQEDFATSMQVNMKYGLPLLITFILSTTLSSAVGIYWVTSNLFSAAQEYIMRHKKAELKELDKQEKEKHKKE